LCSAELSLLLRVVSQKASAYQGTLARAWSIVLL
jgi:hypothetical protein